jgi:hypothetical protein
MTGNISLGTVFEAGRNLLPYPAATITAFMCASWSER